MNLKVFNLILGVNETRFLVQYESCEFTCGLNESICTVYSLKSVNVVTECISDHNDTNKCNNCLNLISVLNV